MSRRSLWPREHGAYFQLAMPLLAAWLLGPPTVAMGALTCAACLAFLANEPLLVMLGHRGARLRTSEGSRARTRLVTLAGVAVAAGSAGLVLAPHEVLIAAALVAAPTTLVIALAWRQAEHTLPGEIVAAVALTGASVPVAVAGGTSLTAALVLWLGWAIGFVASVLSIHRVIARHRRPATWIDYLLGLLLLGVTAASLVAATRGAPVAIAAPLVALATLLVIAPPSASRLRVVGVAIVVAAAGSVVFAALVV